MRAMAGGTESGFSRLSRAMPPEVDEASQEFRALRAASFSTEMAALDLRGDLS